MTRPQTPFHDLDAYVALPRLSGLALSPDGTRLVTGASTPDEDATRYVTALWEVDPRGERPARRLTWGAEGEANAVFTVGGDLLFTAKRGDDEVPALWRLPAAGGEAHLLARHPGGVEKATTARDAEAVVVQASALARSADLEREARVRKARTDKKVSAILHQGYPVRYWDHDLGPASPRLYGCVPNGDGEAGELRDLTADAGTALAQTDHDLSPDGTTVFTTWHVPEGRGSRRTDLVRVDVATGRRTRLLAADDATEYEGPLVSPDGTRLLFVEAVRSTPQEPPRPLLRVMDLATGEVTRLAEGWDRWASAVTWLPGSDGLLVAADEAGRGPLFLLDLTGAPPVRLTDEGTFTDLAVAPDGSAAYALRTSYAYPPEVVRVGLDGAGEPGFVPGSAAVTVLAGPAARPALPGTLTEVGTTAADGVPVRAWLALPEGTNADRPAPLLLWIHGGPLNSWNGWSWRWNPWLLVAQGYAVLLPDPALSTGYGQDFIRRGWGRWGAEPFTDLMAVTDAAAARDDIDATRTAAMGGSFGGYMASWVAGHTDRFRAVVTHAGLWALEGFGPTTDASDYWVREMTPEMMREHSPHRFVGQIRTPMLVVHGDKDYRVPIGEGLRLWWDLLHSSGLPQAEDGSTPHRFLYFPDENHWVLTPQHAKLWYQVVSVFLAQHVLGEEPGEVPELLG